MLNARCGLIGVKIKYSRILEKRSRSVDLRHKILEASCQIAHVETYMFEALSFKNLLKVLELELSRNEAL